MPLILQQQNLNLCIVFTMCYFLKILQLRKIELYKQLKIPNKVLCMYSVFTYI